MKIIVVAMAAGMMLGGCCGAVGPREVQRGPLPVAITLEEQRGRLDAWSRGLPRVRAKTVVRGVELTYRDEKGAEHKENVEGTLLLRQQVVAADGKEAAAAQVALVGMAFDQRVFEAMKNQTNWWFVVRLDTKTAWVGDATRPVNYAGLSQGSRGILRADMVLDLLGLTPLPAQIFRNGAEGVVAVMRADDEAGTNDVWVERVRYSGGTNTGPTDSAVELMREVVVDRRMGEVRHVRIYDPVAGVMFVESELSDYRAVSSDEEGKVGAARFPYHVVVRYPGQHMMVSLQFDTVVIPERVGDIPTPDFSGQDLKVIRVE